MISSALLPSAQSASERRTPVNALARGSPNASRMRERRLEVRDLLVDALGEAPHAALVALLRRPAAGILEDRVGQLEPVLDAAEPAGEHRREPEVGVARGIGGLELDVRVLGSDRLGARNEAQRGLSVVGSPERVGAREVARPQADQGRHARCGDGDHSLQIAQDAGDEGLALGRHALGAVAAGQQIAAVLVDRDMKVPTVSDALRRHERCEGGSAAHWRGRRCGSSRARAADRRPRSADPWRRARSRVATRRTRRGSGRSRARCRRGRRAAPRGTHSRRASRSGCRRARDARPPARRSPAR